MVDEERLQRVLEQAAREQRTLTYGQLLAFFGRKVGPNMVAALCRDLGRVCDRVRDAGGPDLAALVVRKSDGLPGGGYFAWLRVQGHYTGPDTGPEARRAMDERQATVFAYYAQPPPPATRHRQSRKVRP